MGHSFDDYLLRRTDLVDESCPHCNDNPRERNSSLERQNSIKEFLGILLTSKIHKRVRVFPESLEGIRGKQPDVVYVEELPTLAQKFLADHVQESCLTGSWLPVQYNELVRGFFNDMFQEVLDEGILLRILDPNQAFLLRHRETFQIFRKMALRVNSLRTHGIEILSNGLDLAVNLLKLPLDYCDF